MEVAKCVEAVASPNSQPHLHLKSLISEFAYSYHSKVMQKWMPNSVFTFGASFLESREERSSSSI